MSDRSIFKRCGCRKPDTGKPLGNCCPRLRRKGGTWSPDHGTWHYQLELPPTPDRRRRQLRRGGFDTKDAAAADREHAKALLAAAGADSPVRHEITALLLGCRSGTALPDVETIRRRVRGGLAVAGAPTLAEYLPRWLSGHKVDPATARIYEAHIRLYIIPHLGALRLDQLKVGHIKAMYAALDERNGRIRAARASDDPAVRASVSRQRPLSTASYHRIRATLRVALNDAIAEELISFNPARHVKLGDGSRPKAREWTAERVAAWRATGYIPGTVMIWNPTQTGTFLDHAAEHEPGLYPLYLLIALRGLRRGEACGIRRFDLDLHRKQLTIANQLAQLGWTPVQKKPKSRAGDRTVALDEDTVEVLRAHLRRRNVLAERLGIAWHNSGLIFTQPDGQPLHPSMATKRFKQLIDEAGLPPIRLHDLRHVAASIAHAAGADLKSISKLLGHSTIAITADTYTEVFAEVDHAQAAASADVVSLKRRRKEA
jgi:integrase